MKIFIKLTSIIFVTLLFSCNGHSQKSNDCLQSLSAAKKALSNFYLNSNAAFLEQAIDNCNIGLKCKETRIESVELKLSILSLQSDYKKAVEFIDSLQETDFSQPYKKVMSSNFYSGLICETLKDSSCANSHFRKAIVAIEESLLLNNSPDNPNFEIIYYDDLFIKRRILPLELFAEEILRLRQKFPTKSTYFEAVFETLKDLK
jgi:hypothetical protein